MSVSSSSMDSDKENRDDSMNDWAEQDLPLRGWYEWENLMVKKYFSKYKWSSST